MLGLLDRGGIRVRRATAVLGVLAVPIAAGVTAVPAAAAAIYTVSATIGVGTGPDGVGG